MFHVPLGEFHGSNTIGIAYNISENGELGGVATSDSPIFTDWRDFYGIRTIGNSPKVT